MRQLLTSLRMFWREKKRKSNDCKDKHFSQSIHGLDSYTPTKGKGRISKDITTGARKLRKFQVQTCSKQMAGLDQQ